MLSRYSLLLLFFTVTLSLIANEENTLNSQLPNTPNEINDIRLKVIEQGDKFQCHTLTTQDTDWLTISFDQLPQNKHFCLRLWISIDESLLPKNPSLLVGMLGASKFYWDEMLISKNGVIGKSKSEESPGVIKTLVRLENSQLKTGMHLLSAEVSTFNVGKKLNKIGYLLTLVDDQKLHLSILGLSIISAVFIGVSFILAIIFQLIYWLYHKNFSYQIFSIFCLASTFILTLEQAKFWYEYTYDWHVFRLTAIYAFTFIASFLLPVFYLFHYQIPYKKQLTSIILISLICLSLVNSSYDIASTLLFSIAIVCSFIINIYQLKIKNQGIVTVITLILSLLFLYFIPDYFLEFGFSIVFVIVVMTILIILIKEMHVNKLDALKAERVKTELLRRNMQPHFLMNCLTQLMELIEIKPKDAIEFIALLSDEFRQLTTQNNKQVIPISEEISLCNKHLTIMSYRYQQLYHLDICGDTEGIVIPPSILHSQIENCFTHNKISSTKAFKLTVTLLKGRVNLVLKTPIEKQIDHKGTGLGEQYIKAKLAEVDQINNHNKAQLSTFKSYQKSQYWVSEFSFDDSIKLLSGNK